jgi:hypothetical protein
LIKDVEDPVRPLASKPSAAKFVEVWIAGKMATG